MLMSLKKIASLCRWPLAVLETPREKWTFVILSGIFSILFIHVFVPFNINLWWPISQPLLRWLILSGYGIVGMLVLLASQLLLRPWFGPTRYHLVSFLLWTLFEILLISIAISLVYEIIIKNNIHNFSAFAKDVLLTTRHVGLIICIPYSIGVPLMISRKHAAKAAALQKDLTRHDTKLLTVNDENDRPVISMPSDHLIYIKSEDNYIAVVYRAGDKIKKTLVRSTLKKLEDRFTSANMLRTHRSFMVNMDNIGEVRRTTRGFAIKMKHVEEEIPVSSNYKTRLEEKIAGSVPVPYR